jgi:hypothetical protein
MIRLVLRGQDAEIMSLLSRLRLSGNEDLIGLIPVGECPNLELYTEISSIPILQEEQSESWRQDVDYLVTSSPIPSHLDGLSCLSPMEAESKFLSNEQEAKEASDIQLQDIHIESLEISESKLGLDFPKFAHELRREIRRSRRYHLGFCFTLFRLVNENNEAMSAERFIVEPLLSLPSRVGRLTDSWGVSPEGILLHLAPEIQEQARLLKRRLSTALEDQVREFEDSPWRCQSAQALYPQNGEKASELVRHAMSALSRRK